MTTSCGVLIVGGGPAGYSTAIALAQQGCEDIVVLERSPDVDYFDPTKSFTYCLFPHGKDVLRDIGLSDIDTAGCVKNGMEFMRIYPNGKTKHRVFRRTAHGGKSPPVSDLNTWMQRHSLTRTLYNHIQAHHADAVQVVFNAQVTNVSFPTARSERITVSTCEGIADPDIKAHGAQSEALDEVSTKQYVCQLLVGADGAGSVVRTALHASQPDAGWDYTNYPSPSGRLHWKVLAMPPCPTINASIGSIPSHMTTTLCGKKTPGFRDGRHALRASMLSGVDEIPRGLVFVLHADDPFWHLKTTDELYSVLQRAFPQVDDWHRLVPLPVAQRFVSSPDTAFKHPGTTRRLTAVFESDEERSNTAHLEEDMLLACMRGWSCAVLLGDAAHVFPPDLGQGVNSTLLDVATLKRCLRESSSDPVDGLQAYEDERLPENLALTQTLQMGAGYQYQPLANTLQSWLHKGSNTVRFVLARCLPQVVSPPVALMLLQPSKEERENGCATLYQESWRKHRATTVNLCIMLVTLLLGGLVAARGRLYTDK